MQNFSRITKEPHIIEIMSDEYALLSETSKSIVHQAMSKAVNDFQQAFFRKKALKNKYFFWRKRK